jgi:hypothetical protein
MPHGIKEMRTRFYLENLKRIDHLEDGEDIIKIDLKEI